MNSVTERNQEISTRPLPVGYKLINRYQIEKVLGSGGFGITYKCRDEVKGNNCAVKELFVKKTFIRADNGIDVVYEEGKKKFFKTAVAGFLREARTLSLLQDTDYAITLIEYFKANGTAYFAMRLVDGKSIKDLMNENGGKLGIAKTSAIMGKVAETLLKIHSEFNILHQDISPDNIMVDEDEIPTIIDFGSARDFIRNSSENDMIILKPGFAPPEQFAGKNMGPYTDIYAFAASFYYMATGIKVPKAVDRMKGKTYTPLVDIIPACGDELSDTVDRALKLSINERIKTMEEFCKVLNKSADEAEPYLEIIRNNRAIRRWEIPAGVKIIVGRDCNLSNIGISSDNSVSRQHCAIVYERSARSFLVEDLSKNGTYVAKIRLKPQQKYAFSPGTCMVLGVNDVTVRMGIKKCD